jgi:hypothetical protein
MFDSLPSIMEDAESNFFSVLEIAVRVNERSYGFFYNLERDKQKTSKELS